MKILLSYRHYPLSFGQYFKWALQELGHQVWTIGEFVDTIPWNPTRDYTEYLDYPDTEVMGGFNFYDADMAVAQCPLHPDLILSVDSAFYLLEAEKVAKELSEGLPNEKAVRSAIVLTDPHALKQHYLESVEYYEHVFCLQAYYAPDYATKASGDPRPVYYFPYAADDKRHFWTGTDFYKRPYDVGILSGLLYPKRKEAIEEMKRAGLNVAVNSGILYEEASEWYGDCKIAFGYSSEQDLCARFFESLAMRTLTFHNRVPDMLQVPDLIEGKHYIAYDSVEECVEKALYYTEHQDEAWEIASAGYAAIWAGNHFWKQRCNVMLDILFPNHSQPS